jgi:hypothetical protein
MPSDGADPMVTSKGVGMEMAATSMHERSVCEVHAAKVMASETHAAKVVTSESHAAEVVTSESHAAKVPAEMSESTTPKAATAEVSPEARLGGVGREAQCTDTEGDHEPCGKAPEHPVSSTINWRFPLATCPGGRLSLPLGQP